MAQHHQSDSRYKPLGNVCMALNAFHVYADEARVGRTRAVMAHHYCAHVRGDLRQCVVYDSNEKNARLIGVEYMIPKETYLRLDPEEQKLWHSHEFEVMSGMLMLPKPEDSTHEDWNKNETEGMREIMDLYGKTWHTWQIDLPGHEELPLGKPVLMGSLTSQDQMDLTHHLKARDDHFKIDHKQKREMRQDANVHAESTGIPENADWWWKEAEQNKRAMT